MSEDAPARRSEVPGCANTARQSGPPWLHRSSGRPDLARPTGRVMSRLRRLGCMLPLRPLAGSLRVLPDPGSAS